MGKSPGRWIKTVLFGKKASKSNISKGKDSLKSSTEEALVSSKTPNAGLAVSSTLISQTEPIPDHNNEGSFDLEQRTSTNLPHDGVILVPGDQGANKQGTPTSHASNDSDRVRRDQAATKAQAAFRGYLARRAFRALMGIIRLQALVRGHLVRRQAVATLCCVRAIVKLQALVRGRRENAKVSELLGLKQITHSQRFLMNSFICKLFASSPNTKSLCLQYDLAETNSAWSWLERWTYIHVWQPLPHPKKAIDSKNHTKTKQSVRKLPVAKSDNGPIRSTSASEKPKRTMRKVSGHSVDVVQESSPNELEKVKRNLRKVSNSTNETADQKEVETEKPKLIPRKTSGSRAPDISNRSMSWPAESEKPKHVLKKASITKSEPVDQVDAESERLKGIPQKSLGSVDPDVPDQVMDEFTEMKKDTPEPVSKHSEEECTPKQIDGSYNDHPTSDSPRVDNCGKDENTQLTNGKLISKDNQASNENQKTSRRRASLPAKQEYPEPPAPNTPKLPSYMAATASAKAKLRAQGSPRSDSDVIDQNGLTRRHSLPSSTNGKLSLLSPQTQKPQANNKGMIKQDRSILSSKDGNEKVAQVEWRR